MNEEVAMTIIGTVDNYFRFVYGNGLQSVSENPNEVKGFEEFVREFRRAPRDEKELWTYVAHAAASYNAMLPTLDSRY